MEYCNSGDVAMPNMHPDTGRIMYSSRANMAIYDIPLTLTTYAKFGIPPEKIAIILPWFGSDFRCAGTRVRFSMFPFSLLSSFRAQFSEVWTVEQSRHSSLKCGQWNSLGTVL